MLTKDEARQAARERLRSTLPEERVAWSAAIRAALRRLPEYREARTILLFACLPSEPDLLPLMRDAESSGRTFAFPRVDASDRMTLHRIRSADELVLSHYKFREPPPDSEAVPLTSVDLIVIPGIAFTPAGVRLGRGKGHYDRLLGNAQRRAFLAGVCFHTQLADGLPSEPHDVRMDAVITEQS